MFDRDGSDAMRWFLMASPILRGGNLVVTEQGIREGVRQARAAAVEHLVLPVAVRERGRTASGAVRTDSAHVLDRYVLAKTAALVDDVDRRRWTSTTSPARASGCATTSRC